eukprot:14136265-Alexandrium_andersonii.AAC.1
MPLELRRVIAGARRKAAGLDGWGATEVAALPEEAFDRLVQILEETERTGEWPAPLTWWKVSYVPKTSSGIGP